MRAPWFWQDGGWPAPLLAPLGAVYAAATAHRLARPGWRAPVPVVCCGNAVAGGSGKTTLALDLGARLLARGVPIAFVSRGYGGRGRGLRQVGPADVAAEVGDEPCLLAAVAPTFVGADRAASARAAVAGGAQAIVMDDGLQNPGLAQDVRLLVIDGQVGFGNGRPIPAGPLRELVSAVARRCTAAVLIGPDRTGALERIGRLPVLRATLDPCIPPALRGRRVLAFAGIGRPAKLFDGLRAAGLDVVATRGFPDHHRYGRGGVRRLLARAEALGAVPVTTPKDAVRLPADLRARVQVAAVALRWDDPEAPEALLDPVRPR